MKKIKAATVMESVENYITIQKLIFFKDVCFSCLLMLCLYTMFIRSITYKNWMSNVAEKYIKTKNFDKFEYYFYVWKNIETFVIKFLFRDTNKLYIETLNNNEYIIKVKIVNENNIAYYYINIIRSSNIYFIKLKESKDLVWYFKTYGNKNDKYIKRYIKELEVVDTTISFKDLDVKKFEDLFPILDEMYNKGKL